MEQYTRLFYLTTFFTATYLNFKLSVSTKLGKSHDFISSIFAKKTPNANAVLAG